MRADLCARTGSPNSSWGQTPNGSLACGRNACPSCREGDPLPARMARHDLTSDFSTCCSTTWDRLGCQSIILAKRVEAYVRLLHGSTRTWPLPAGILLPREDHPGRNPIASLPPAGPGFSHSPDSPLFPSGKIANQEKLKDVPRPLLLGAAQTMWSFKTDCL